jgi:DNA-directed RNA polymerase subunit beta'
MTLPLFYKLIRLCSFIKVNSQEVYDSQGIRINRKHFELIVAEMLKYVEIRIDGKRETVSASQIQDFQSDNAKPVLLGINKLPFSNESFLRAASFEDTPRQLASAALENRIDELKGFHENIILGRL